MHQNSENAVSRIREGLSREHASIQVSKTMGHYLARNEVAPRMHNTSIRAREPVKPLTRDELADRYFASEPGTQEAQELFAAWRSAQPTFEEVEDEE